MPEEVSRFGKLHEPTTIILTTNIAYFTFQMICFRIVKGHLSACERASMGMRKGINGSAKGHQWECERASMGMRKGINGKGNYKLFDPSCYCLPAPVGDELHPKS